jgi:E3 ubiquitin-protein ligase MARCH6
MQEAEEQGLGHYGCLDALQLMIWPDTCRICSAPGEPEQPLFYPCKCSGTIRYIHQDWLVTLPVY